MIAKRLSVILSVGAALSAVSAAMAQSGDLYAGKTLRIIVGLEAGGTVDTLARTFSVHLRKHIPGNPAIIVRTCRARAAGAPPTISRSGRRPMD